MPSNGRGVGDGVTTEVGNAAVLGKWIPQRVWRVSVGKSVMGSLKRRMRWEPIKII
jgi:hypothetical protein